MNGYAQNSKKIAFMPFSLDLPFLPVPYFYGKNWTLSADWRPHLQPPLTMNMLPKYKVIFLDKKIKLYTGSLPLKSGLLESKHRTNTILEKPYMSSCMFPRLLVLMGYTVLVLHTLVYFDPLSTNYFLQTSFWNSKYLRFFYCLTTKDIHICPQFSSLNNQWCMSTIIWQHIPDSE